MGLPDVPLATESVFSASLPLLARREVLPPMPEPELRRLLLVDKAPPEKGVWESVSSDARPLGSLFSDAVPDDVVCDLESGLEPSCS